MEENDKCCPQHNLIEKNRQERYLAIEDKFKNLEKRLEERDKEHTTEVKSLLSKDTFWWAVGVCIGIFSFFFLSIITIREKIAEERSLYIPRSEFSALQNECREEERRLSDILDTKEDKHPGTHDPYTYQFPQKRKD